MNGSEAIISRGSGRRTIPRHAPEALRRFSGAWSARVTEPAHSRVPEHFHDWPVLSLYLVGGCTRRFDAGEVRTDGPSAVLHPARESHSSSIGEAGLVQVDVQFDPAWLRGAGTSWLDRMICRNDGRVAAAASRLARRWMDPTVPETVLASETAAFIAHALHTPVARMPAWLDDARSRLDALRPSSASRVAQELGLHPSWFAQAYRAAAGEGVRQTVMRRRVEAAMQLFRTSGVEAAEIAVAAGFYDQSHMIRCFKAVLGRTPSRGGAEEFGRAGEVASAPSG